VPGAAYKRSLIYPEALMRVANLLVRWGVALLLLAAASAPIASAADLPTSIALPNGWLPEGIVSGRGPVLYAGS
jgi:hypothetical protein